MELQQEVRVLVVEDNQADFVLVRRMLESMKPARLVPVRATSLAAAIEALAQAIDVVLLDLNLPDSQDLSTLRRLRACAPLLPILILTGIEDRERAVQALTEGAQDYLVKGHVDQHLLQRAIFRHLNTGDLQTPA